MSSGDRTHADPSCGLGASAAGVEADSLVAVACCVAGLLWVGCRGQGKIEPRLTLPSPAVSVGGDRPIPRRPGIGAATDPWCGRW